MSEQRDLTFVDDQTGIKLVLEPEIFGQERATVYASDRIDDFSEEVIAEAVRRLVRLAQIASKDQP